MHGDVLIAAKFIAGISVATRSKILRFAALGLGHKLIKQCVPIERPSKNCSLYPDLAN